MILCLCRGVSDHTVESVIAGGADSVDRVRQTCGAGGDCGACSDLLEALVARARARPHWAAVPA